MVQMVVTIIIAETERISYAHKLELLKDFDEDSTTVICRYLLQLTLPYSHQKYLYKINVNFLRCNSWLIFQF